MISGMCLCYIYIWIICFIFVQWNKSFSNHETLWIKYNGRRIIYNLCKNQEVIIRVECHEEQVKIRKGFRRGCYLSVMILNVYAEEIKEEAMYDIKIGKEFVNTLRCVAILVLELKARKPSKFNYKSVKVNYNVKIHIGKQSSRGSECERK